MLVDLESPYAGDVERNVRYARACMADSLARGEYPLASHLLYTQPDILRDDDPAQRNLGIVAGKQWAQFADATVVYTDLGVSKGMRAGIEDAERHGRTVIYRELGGRWGTQEMTARQRLVLYAFIDLLAELGYCPSVRQIGKRVGIGVNANVWRHLHALQRLGYIEWETKGPRRMRLLPKPLALREQKYRERNLMAKTPTTRKASSTRKRNLHVVDGTTGRVRAATVKAPRVKKTSDDGEKYKQTLLEVSDKEMLRTLALLQQDVDKAKEAHGRSGVAVQAAQEKLKLALHEVGNRYERATAKQQKLDGV